MPWELHRYQQCGDLHFVTFSCRQREPGLATPTARRTFEECLERTRRSYRFFVCGYVVMPEHVHLLVSEPERSTLATALQALKQAVTQRLHGNAGGSFWQARYYDFNVFSDARRIEKLRYMHRNPVVRGLVERPEDWEWSSFRHCLTGAEGAVEIESWWTARKRELAGELPMVRSRNTGAGEVNIPTPATTAGMGHPRGCHD
jgi:putative transposase